MRYLVYPLTLLLFVIFVVPSHAVNIQEIESPKGIGALLVEDYTVPLVAISFSFVGGSVEDSVGKEGTSDLLTIMLDEGAGPYDSESLLAKLDELGITYGFNSDRDYFEGNATILLKDFEESVDVFRLMLTRPRFDDGPTARMRDTALNILRRDSTSPNFLISKFLRKSLYGDHPYSRPVRGEVSSVSTITRSDLADYHRRVFALDNLTVGIVGAITPSDASTLVDTLFGDLPSHASLSSSSIGSASVRTGVTHHIPMDIPQTTISFVFPGITRDDPDFFAAYLVNHVLGGGTFSSRLYSEIREKRGLAYNVYSHLSFDEHSGVITGSSATSSERADQTKRLLLDEFERIATEGPTAEELASAKSYVTGAYAINNLDTSTKIASVLVAIQRANLGNDYIDRREAYINSVTLDDARRVARRLFGATPTFVTVGK